MLLHPQRTKYRKVFKGKASNHPKSRGSYLAFGEYGLKAVTAGRVSAQQIESMRRAMSRVLKKKGKLIRRIFPDVALTKKPAETRMGGGKGSPDTWCALVNPGRILFEVVGANYETCQHAFELAAAKLHIRTKISSREGKGEL